MERYNNEKKQETIRNRQVKDKAAFLDYLRKDPGISIACLRSGVSRQTYYRWLGEDPEFAKNVETAIREGNRFMNDIANSTLLNMIKEKNFQAVKYRLGNCHEDYLSGEKRRDYLEKKDRTDALKEFIKTMMERFPLFKKKSDKGNV